MPTQSPVVVAWAGTRRTPESVFGFAVLDVNRPGDHRVPYTVINVVVQTIIQPRFTGDAVGISARVAFVSLIFWAYVLGTLGALLAVPATLFLKSVLLDNSVPASWVNALVSASPSKEKPGAVRRTGRQAAAESS